MEKPPSVYYRVNDLAKERGWDVSNILHYGGTGELQLCLLVPNQTLMEPIWRLGLNSIPIKYPSSDRAHVVDDAFGHLYFNIRLIENSEPIPISKEDALKIRTAAGWSLRETICKNLVVTHEEKLRFEATGDLASNTKATTHSKPPRIRIPNELHEVIWATYLALAKKRSREPTSGEVWLELKREPGRVLREYDKREIIQEITEGTIHWIDADAGKHTLTKGSFKTVLSRIKNDRKK